jgi:hypothetical protein
LKKRDHAVDPFAAQNAPNTEARTYAKLRHLERSARFAATAKPASTLGLTAASIT